MEGDIIVGELLEAIDMGLSNRYKVVEGDDHTLCVVDRETGKHYDIIVAEATL